MKKAIALILTLCTLLCTLTACKSCRSKYLPKDTDTEQETQTPDVDITANPYAGMTQQDLIDLYYESLGHGTWGSSMTNMRNTPFYFLLSLNNGGKAYSKLTGELVTLCKDPLCTHENCPFNESISNASLAVSDDRIYLLVSYSSYATLYSFTLTFDDAEIIASWQGADGPYCIWYYQNALYYSAPHRKDGVTEKKLFVLKPDSKEIILYEPDSNNYGSTRTLIGKYLYYYGNNGIWRHDMETGEDMDVLPDSVMDIANGDVTTWFNTASLDGELIEYQVLRAEGSTYVSHTYIRDVTTGEIKPWATGVFAGSYIVSYEDHTSNAYKDDPFYAYYCQSDREILMGKENRSGGELTCFCVTDGTANNKIRISTDGIPDNLDVVTGDCKLYSDGKCVYVTYHSYKAYQNEYNDSVTRENHAELWEQYSGLMLLDMDNQKEYHIGPDHDVEWFPDRTN